MAAVLCCNVGSVRYLCVDCFAVCFGRRVAPHDDRRVADVVYCQFELPGSYLGSMDLIEKTIKLPFV